MTGGSTVEIVNRKMVYTEAQREERDKQGLHTAGPEVMGWQWGS